MLFPTRRLVVAAILAGALVPATSAARPIAATRHGQAHHHNSRAGCPKTFTVSMQKRAIYWTFRGHRDVSRRERAIVARVIRCERFPRSERYVRGVERRVKARWRHRRYEAAHPFSTALASWYVAAGGPIACGGDSYALGVANRTLPCGTRLEICYASCVDAVVFDRGPFVYSRDLDLSGAVKDAIGFPDGVVDVRYRILR